MSRGILIFAQNNAEMDYIKLAVFAARRAKQYLNVPVSIATDSKEWLLETVADAEDVFDKIIDIWYDTTQSKKFNDGSMYGKDIKWNNFTRADCFDISPYDETIVIDSDYIIASDCLSKVWGGTQDFLIYRNSYDIAQWRDDNSFKYINDHAIPFYWATVFYFKKTKTNELFFKFIKNVKENWAYYRSLYLIDSPTFRNDFAFSIAIHVMNGSIDGVFEGHLPGKMYYTLDRDILLDAKDSKFKFLVEKEKHNGEYTLAKTDKLDMHIMNKFSLSRFIDGASNV